MKKFKVLNHIGFTPKTIPVRDFDSEEEAWDYLKESTARLEQTQPTTKVTWGEHTVTVILDTVTAVLEIVEQPDEKGSNS